MRRNRVWFLGLAVCVIALFSVSCGGSKPTEIKVVFPSHVWNRFMPMDAKFEVTNVKKTYEVAVRLSVIKGFELDYVPIEMVITAPDGQENIINRTFAVKKDGNYLGKAYGDVWTTEVIIYPDKQFTQAGTYSVYIENRTQYYELLNTESLAFIVRPVKK